MISDLERRLRHPDDTDCAVSALMPCDPADAYDFERIGPGLFRLTIAVPGFERNDIDVTADAGCLRIRGARPAADRRSRVLHRGLDDTLDRTFLMLRPLDLVGWDVRAGLLRIELQEGPDIGAQAARPPVLHHVEVVALAA